MAGLRAGGSIAVFVYGAVVALPGSVERAARATAAARAARAAAQLPLATVAAQHGVAPRVLRDRLRSLPGRGGCEGTMVELTKSRRTVEERSVVLARPGCPPPLLRAAESDSSENVRHAGAGSAGWASRAAGAAAPARASLAAAVASSGMSMPESRERAAALADCPPLWVARLAGRWDKSRFVALANPGCPPEALARGSRDPDSNVRLAVARHARCPDTAAGGAGR